MMMKPRRRGKLGRSRGRWKKNYLREIGFESENRFELA
jgi:hypothetical protein